MTARNMESRKTPERNTRNIDHGWAWVVLICSSISFTIVGGQLFNRGSYFVIFRNAFGHSRSHTMLAISAQGATFSLSGAIIGYLLRTYGIRTMSLFGGLLLSLCFAMLCFANSLPYVILIYGISGFGSTVVLTSCVAAIEQYFSSRLKMATGLLMSGAGMGISFLAIEIEWAERYYGWRGAMLIQAGLLLQTCICSALIFNNHKTEEGKDTTHSKNKVEHELTEKPPLPPPTQTYERGIFGTTFWLQILAGGFYAACVGPIYQTLKDFTLTTDIQFSYEIIMLCTGLCNGTGRLLGGMLASFIPSTLLNSILPVFCFVAIATLSLATSDWCVLLAVTSFAFINGIQMVTQTLSWGYLFDNDKMPTLVCYSYVALSIPFLAVPPIVGYLVDTYGTYQPGYVLALGCLTVSCVLYTIQYCVHRKRLGSLTITTKENLSTVEEKEAHMTTCSML